jgi:hypothetical protein
VQACTTLVARSGDGSSESDALLPAAEHHSRRATHVHVRLLQIYVEIQRARLIKRLAKIKEGQGKIDEAAEIMQEVAVSAFSYTL